MRYSIFIVPILLLSVMQSCGQIGNHQHKTIDQMEYREITHPTVRAAVTAWQQGDVKLWLSFFKVNPVLLDDGHSRDFKKFSSEAIGHEYFRSIDKVENKGLDIYGQFHSDNWGDFKTYFKFHLNEEGKIFKLEIGQANY